MKTPKRPRDLNQWAKRMVDIATGEVGDEGPKSRAHDLVLEGAKIGGRRRAETLTPQRRSEIAREAAKARWKKD